MVERKQRPSTVEDPINGQEEFPEDERWTRLVCLNGHTEKINNVTGNLLWYCPECGERRSVESNHITPSETKTDKI